MDAYKIYIKSRKHYLKGNLFFAKLYLKMNRIINNSYIPYTAEIGKESIFGYGGIGVVLHPDCKIGKNCTIGQNCTIGGRTGHGGPPIIGDNVYIGPGARLLGSFRIGNNVIIGANAVVISEVPNNCIVAGVPAKIIRTDVSKFQNENII
ncbi:serine acetyltransferase [Bacillus thuringiensis]|uniref:Serine acetyltransferase n=1 Tax=Bacillus thuringiensis subsp. higo TaxID=132266 RepID=A0A9X6LWI0_BACUH|nr:serine acetyltransferase [Bacillus thuringiensis]MED2785254.1 serine acetyltransferase [Bacillus thuringiensis]MED2807227.1 serine acetyltransferase [Bacillus thuringiensis]MED2825590.1 serine acetyltransferase [Bacillus thuringiensis]MED2831692.1 serine acetyltransferase [Bacillus thuringiensis]MED2847666.1 serine acetyltransferase [Bacillus thuringiensis]